MREDRTSVIIVAAGKGTRMGVECPKQFIEVDKKPILYYTINAFEKSHVDDIIIVTSKDHVSYVQEQIVEKYGFKKVRGVVRGGQERYHSVYEGLSYVENAKYVMVHDGARPFITPKMIDKAMEAVKEYPAVIVGVKSKDTVKIVNEEGFVETTPNRNQVWNIQTPQCFTYDLLKTAYDKVVAEKYNLATDDAMVVEYATKQRIKIVEGEYTNIKITTPDDLREEFFIEY